MSHINLVREDKSTMRTELFCPPDKARIKAAAAHFKVLDTDYAKSLLGSWNL